MTKIAATTAAIATTETVVADAITNVELELPEPTESLPGGGAGGEWELAWGSWLGLGIGLGGWFGRGRGIGLGVGLLSGLGPGLGLGLGVGLLHGDPNGSPHKSLLPA